MIKKGDVVMKKKYLFVLLAMVLLLSACSSEDQLAIDNTSGPVVIVDYIENSMESVRKMEKTLDDLKEELIPYVGVNTLNKLIEGYKYEPRMNYWIISSEYDEDVITYEDVKGLSLTDLKAGFKDLHNEYVSSNFGDITVNIEISEVVEDEYFTYVFTKRTITMEHFGDRNIDELIIYKKYILSNKDEGWLVSDIKWYYDYDVTSFLEADIDSDELEIIIQFLNEAKIKFLTIDDEQIDF